MLKPHIYNHFKSALHFVLLNYGIIIKNQKEWAAAKAAGQMPVPKWLVNHTNENKTVPEFGSHLLLAVYENTFCLHFIFCTKLCLIAKLHFVSLLSLKTKSS